MASAAAPAAARGARATGRAIDAPAASPEARGPAGLDIRRTVEAIAGTRRPARP